jgi:tripartite-type tricarboxylate transporter receptor subunit TctC
MLAGGHSWPTPGIGERQGSERELTMKAATDMPRRRPMLVVLLALAAWAVALQPAAAQVFPSKPIRLIVPFPPGGPTDIVARPLGQLLSDALKQPVIVDNRGGAGGSVGADSVAKSPPDGYTLLMGTVGTNAINGTLYRKLPYDPVRDFTPIALVASAPVAVVVNPAASIMSIKDLIAQAAASPGRMAFGSAGNGTPGHLTGEMLAAATGVKLQHVPYKGSAPALNDLLGNQIPMMFDPLQSVIQHVRAGKLRALAISSRTRSPALPEVPTLEEAGVKGFEATAWWGVFAPANLPAGVAARLRTEIERIARSDAFRDKLGSLGVQPASEPVSFADFQKSEVAKWGNAVRDSGAVVD